MELKSKGLLLTRRLSLADSTFETHIVRLNEDQKATYNKCCRVWVNFRNAILNVYETVALFQGREEFARAMAEYWAGHQRCFRAMCRAFKVKEVSRLARQ